MQTASAPKMGKSTNLWQNQLALGYGHPIAALLLFLSPLQVTFPPLPTGWHWQRGGPCTGGDTCQLSQGHGVAGGGEGTHDGCLLLQHPAHGSVQTMRGHLGPGIAAATSSPVISWQIPRNASGFGESPCSNVRLLAP